MPYFDFGAAPHNTVFTKRGVWEEVCKGGREGLHLLASHEEANDYRRALVVDFGQIVSLLFEHLTYHSAALGERWRLRSPYLEHFSQSLARFFMRVGLPSNFPPFK